MCRLNSADFADQMVTIRRWLDHRRCTVDNFEYYRMVGDIIVIQIDFTRSPDAAAFAAEFAGEMALPG
jgi:hypothetical protein